MLLLISNHFFCFSLIVLNENFIIKITENGVEVTRIIALLCALLKNQQRPVSCGLVTLIVVLSMLWTDAAQVIVKSIDLFSRWQFSLVHFVGVFYWSRSAIMCQLLFQLIDRSRRVAHREREERSEEEKETRSRLCACASRSCENYNLW